MFLRIRTCHCKSFPLNSVDTSAKSKENKERLYHFDSFHLNSSVDIQIFYIVTKLLHVDGIHLFAHLLTLDNVYAMTHQMVI